MAKISRGSSQKSFAAVKFMFAAVISLFAAGNPFSFFPPIPPPRTKNQKMAKKSKDSSQKSFDVVKFLFAAVISLFDAGNPFRRKAQPASPTAPPPQQLGLGRDSASVSIPKNRDDGKDGSAKKNGKKRQRDEMGEEYEKRTYGGVEKVSEGGKGGLGRDSASVSIPKNRDDGEDGSVKKNRKKQQRDEMEEEYEKRTYGGFEKVSEGGKGWLGRDSASVSIPKTRDDGEDGSAKKNRKKRQRDEMEEEYEKRTYGGVEKVSEGGKGRGAAVGEKRKTDDVLSEMVVTKESFDDESKLMRTVVIGNLPVNTKRKTILKEFKRFGEVESVRIRSVPIVDSKAPRKTAVLKGKINDAIPSVHAYIVFKDEQSVRAALSHNMAKIGGNHIRVDMACPPYKKLKGEGSLYNRKRIIFVGNLPFDVKDEELCQLFCGVSPSEVVEAVCVIRVPHMSLGKCIVYIRFKTRVSHAKSSDATPSKRKYPETKVDFPEKKLAVPASNESLTKDGKPKPKAASLSPQGLCSSKSGAAKKSRLSLHTFSHGNQETRRAGWAGQKGCKAKSPTVAPTKAKQLLKKRKQENGTLENNHQNKKARRN